MYMPNFMKIGPTVWLVAECECTDTHAHRQIVENHFFGHSGRGLLGNTNLKIDFLHDQ